MAGLGISAPNHCCSGTNKSEMLKLQSAEGDVFEVELEVACMSGFVKNMVEDGDTDEVIPLPNVKTTALGKIIDYFKLHKGKHPEPLPKPLKSANLIDCGVNKRDYDYVNIEQDMLFELIAAANYLDIKSLLDLCVAKVASMIKGRSAEEVRRQFNIRNDGDVTSDSAGAQLTVDSSGPEVTPQRPEATRRALVEKAVNDVELTVDIPEVFKTIEIPVSYRTFVLKTANLQASYVAQAQALDAVSKMDPRMCMKMSYRNFQEADKDRHGVLNLEHFLHYCQLEHKDTCEMFGLKIPFHEELYVEGFACQQFEGQGGVTFTDLQIGSHMVCRIRKEIMAS